MNNSKKLIKNIFKLDELDLMIMSSLIENPGLPYTKIAAYINKSQPTVGLRIKKLNEKGLLEKMYGINFKKIDFTLAQLYIQTSNTQRLIEKIDGNINKILVWSSSGEFNLNMLICGESMKDISNNVYMATKEEKCIKKIKIEFIDKLLSEFILPLKI